MEAAYAATICPKLIAMLSGLGRGSHATPAPERGQFLVLA